MPDSEPEGVVKYRLTHQQQAIPETICLQEINSWRAIMYRLQLIGQSPDRYAGYGYGNISQRILHSAKHFVISGTQTGHLTTLQRAQYCLVTEAMPELNTLQSQGLCKPSSEALTHAMVYQKNTNIQSIIHAHSPEIWRNTQNLNIPHTAVDVAYGTPEMALAVAALFQSGQLNNNAVFTMLGHEDGVIAFGTCMQETADQMIQLLAAAVTTEH